MRIMNLFRRNRKTELMDTNNINMQNMDQSQPVISETLFVENAAPESQESENRKVSLLQQYLDTNFELIGYNEGYRSGNAEYQDRILSRIKADFRLVLDKEMDCLRNQANELKLHMIRVTGISAILEKQVGEKLSQIESQMHALDIQKVLSVDDEGFIAIPVTHFRSGFLRGVEQYQMEKFFASSTSLFNN